MKIVFIGKDKLRIKISLAILAIGLLIIGAAFTPPLNPPQCEGNQTEGFHCIIGANIGTGLIWLLGMALAISGAVAVAAFLVFALIAGNTKKPGKALLITILIVGPVVLTCWYIFIGASAIKESKYQMEIQKRHANFVEYKDVPNISSVSGQSTALTTKPITGSASSVNIDLHNCSPGAAKVQYATGITHFAFSGVRQDKNLESFNASECILYIGKETANQNWDGSLPAKCTWSISDMLSDNQLKFTVTDTGIEFEDFLGNCQDLRAGIAPDL